MDVELAYEALSNQRKVKSNSKDTIENIIRNRVK